MRLISSLILATTLFAAAAAAQPPVEPKPAAPPAPADAKKLCRREPAPTGSMMPGKRTCRTAAEWAAIDAHNDRSGQEMMDQIARNRGSATN